MLLQRFIDFVQQQHLLPSGQEVLLAVSGGRDSVCMAHLCHRAGIPFAVAHCNFHLRPGDCDRDEAFVRRLADSYGVPCHVASFDTSAFAATHSMSVEEAARCLRYEYFSSLVASHPSLGCVATAHHRDDSIETFFLNLLRGTGIAGLHGIRPRTTLTTPLIRPMLCFSRADIDSYVEQHHLAYVEDHTNALLDARRNQLRHRLLPLLRELYPSFDDTMEANIEHLHDTELLYQAYLADLRSRLFAPYPSRLPNLPFPILSLSLPALRTLPAPQTVLFELLRPYGFNAAQVADIMLTKTTGKQFFSPTHVAEFHRGLLLLAPLSEECEREGEKECAERPWRPGDRFRPKGMKGSRLVSDFLKDLHLSRIEKAHVRLRVDADGRILSVVGLRDAEP